MHRVDAIDLSVEEAGVWLVAQLVLLLAQEGDDRPVCLDPVAVIRAALDLDLQLRFEGGNIRLPEVLADPRLGVGDDVAGRRARAIRTSSASLDACSGVQSAQVIVFSALTSTRPG